MGGQDLDWSDWDNSGGDSRLRYRYSNKLVLIIKDFLFQENWKKFEDQKKLLKTMLRLYKQSLPKIVSKRSYSSRTRFQVLSRVPVVKANFLTRDLSGSFKDRQQGLENLSVREHEERIIRELKEELKVSCFIFLNLPFYYHDLLWWWCLFSSKFLIPCLEPYIFTHVLEKRGQLEES